MTNALVFSANSFIIAVVRDRTGNVIFIRHERRHYIDAELNISSTATSSLQRIVPLRNVLRVYFRFIHPVLPRKHRRPIYLVRAASVSTQSVRDSRYPSSPNAFALAGL